jgi:hypothetical protein
MLEKVLRDVAPWCWLYLAAKPSHMGGDVYGLACTMHHPMTCSRQMRAHGLLSGAALSRRATVGGGTFLTDVKPPGLDIRCSVDCLCTFVTEFYMEYIVLTRTYLSYVKVIMALIHVPLVVLQIQTVMRWIPALKCMMSGTCGLLHRHPILTKHKCYRLLRP